ncbi:MAG TPA: hypothetical protein VLM05_20340 [Mycobacteriales bacterium]|nr:hypothetical protein [Mycobacteriales bacterium]
MSILLTRGRRRGAALVAALAVVTFGLIGAGATPAAAGTGFPIYTVPCYSGSNVCLYETAYNQGFTAFALYDVGPTPYYYSVWNMSTRTLLARCGSGMECSTGPRGYPGPGQCYDYIAYVGSAGGVMPPTPVIRASDGLLRICR